MATRLVKICDLADSSCAEPALGYRVWLEGDKQAVSVDLCSTHAAPLLQVMELGERLDLPTKPRVKMEATQLRTTPATKRLKK